MMVYKCAIFAVFLIAVRSIEGADVFGKCLRFFSGEEKPTNAVGKWYCLHGNKKDEYCLNFNCPPANCTDPKTSLRYPETSCPYCEGTCSYGGKIYNVGDPFKCLDGSNLCRCGPSNMIASTRAASNYKIMCGMLVV